MLCQTTLLLLLLLLRSSSSSSSIPDLRVLARRNVVGLVFLVSGRECAVMEVTSKPDGYGSDSGGGRRGGVDSFVPTSVRSTPMSRGGRRATAIATLPSPILAAASLPPALLLGRRRRRRAEEEEAATC